MRVVGDTGIIISDTDHGRAVLLDQGQDCLQALLFIGDRVDQCFAFIHAEAGGQGINHGGIYGDRHIDCLLYRIDGELQDFRLHAINGDPRVYVQYMGRGLNLPPGIPADHAHVAVDHLRCQNLTASRVDALADDHKRMIRADDNRLLGR